MAYYRISVIFKDKEKNTHTVYRNDRNRIQTLLQDCLYMIHSLITFIYLQSIHNAKLSKVQLHYKDRKQNPKNYFR